MNCLETLQKAEGLNSSSKILFLPDLYFMFQFLFFLIDFSLCCKDQGL